MKTLYITSIGVIDTNEETHKKFTNTYLDYKRDTECKLVHALYESGNKVLALIQSQNVNNIINEQMLLKYA